MSCLVCVCVRVHLTGASGPQASLDGVDQRVFPLATEGSAEVIQVQTPDHGSTETTLLQPVNL